MSTIDIQAPHGLSLDDAQQAADRLAEGLAQKFSIDYGWDGDEIHFERPGVHGQISVHDDRIRIQVYLGFLLAMLKAPIEAEIRRHLIEDFKCRF